MPSVVLIPYWSASRPWSSTLTGTSSLFRRIGRAPQVADRGLMSDLAGETIARRRLVWPGVCRRWLRVGSPNSLTRITIGNPAGWHFELNSAN
jgi:hypothetical protein